jgi:hypothetical protein
LGRDIDWVRAPIGRLHRRQVQLLNCFSRTVLGHRVFHGDWSLPEQTIEPLFDRRQSDRLVVRANQSQKLVHKHLLVLAEEFAHLLDRAVRATARVEARTTGEWVSERVALDDLVHLIAPAGSAQLSGVVTNPSAPTQLRFYI